MNELQGLAELIIPHEARSLVPRLHDYFGPWLIEPTTGLALWQHAANLNLRQHVAEHHHEPKSYVTFFDSTGRASDKLEKLSDPNHAIAVIEISGTLMKSVGSMEDGTSTVRARQEIRTASNDPRVAGIILLIDSPGGTVAGTSDLAGEVTRAASMKPVVSYGEDLVASAALWVACQASRFVMNNEISRVGSIGTVIGLYDYSGQAEKDGIKALVFATGPLKGAGFPGAPITDEQKAYFQGIVEETQPAFSKAVSKGRNLPIAAVRELATGGVFTASNALKSGLIDGIQSFDQTLSEMFHEIERTQSAAQPKRGSKMSETTTDRAAATAELNRFVTAFGGDNGAKWFAAGMTYEQALTEQVLVLTARLEAQATAHAAALTARDAQIADLETRLSQIPIGGVKDPVSFKDGEGQTTTVNKRNLHTTSAGLARMAAGIKVPA